MTTKRPEFSPAKSKQFKTVLCAILTFSVLMAIGSIPMLAQGSPPYYTNDPWNSRKRELGD